MKYWSNIKDILSDNIRLASQMLLLILGVYLLIMVEEYRDWKAPVIFIGLLSWFFFRKKTKHPVIWIFPFILLLIDLYSQYFWVANHHFMLVFIVLSVLLYNYHGRIDVLSKNIQIILVVVVMASAFQKLISSQFMNGNFYYYMINRGSLFGVFRPFFPEIFEIAKSNVDNIKELHSTNPNLNQSIILQDAVPNLRALSVVYARITITLEFIVAFALLWKPKATWTHLLLTAMIIGILFTRLETGFMALIAISGLFLCHNIKLRLLYVLITVGCISFIILKIGYH